MKWTECTADNKDFTSRYDAATRKVREVLGSYDKIAHQIYAGTGQSFAGVSVRRWFVNRSLPINVACTLLDLMEEKDPESAGSVSLFDFYPYLEERLAEDFLS